MPGWIVTVALAGVLALILAGAGGTDELVIVVVVLVWFVLLAVLALAAETGVQALSRRLRRGP